MTKNQTKSFEKHYLLPPQFHCSVLKGFTKMNVIKHILSSAYHPSSNRGGKRLVQTVKRGLNKLRIETGDAEEKLKQFLVNDQPTLVTTTGLTPSELFLGRRICTSIELIKPNFQQKIMTYGTKMKYN